MTGWEVLNRALLDSVLRTGLILVQMIAALALWFVLFGLSYFALLFLKWPLYGHWYLYIECFVVVGVYFMYAIVRFYEDKQPVTLRFNAMFVAGLVLIRLLHVIANRHSEEVLGFDLSVRGTPTALGIAVDFVLNAVCAGLLFFVVYGGRWMQRIVNRTEERLQRAIESNPKAIG